MMDCVKKNILMEDLRLVWRANPTWRLGQLLANLMGHHTDPFYWSDEKLEEILNGGKLETTKSKPTKKQPNRKTRVGSNYIKKISKGR